MLKNLNIRDIYLYFFAFLGLVLIVIASIRVMDRVISDYVFEIPSSEYLYSIERCSEPVPMIKRTSDVTKPSQEDKEACEFREKERAEISEEIRRKKDYANSLALIIVGLPLWGYHWRKIKS